MAVSVASRRRQVIVVGLQRLGSGVVKVSPREVSPDQLNSKQVAATNPAGNTGPGQLRSSLSNSQEPSCRSSHRTPDLRLGDPIVLMMAGPRRRYLAGRAVPEHRAARRPITVTFPGASADTVQSTVVQVIGTATIRIDHLLYFSSESDKDGSRPSRSTSTGHQSDTARFRCRTSCIGHTAVAAGSATTRIS